MKHQHDSLIILDFDHTVFNTTKFVVALKEELATHGVSEEEFNIQRQAVKDCCQVVDIDRFVHKLSGDHKQALHDAIHKVITEQAADFVFDDVRDFISRHLSSHDIIILTQGDQELQREKIGHSDLPEGINTVITIGEKDKALADIIGKYEQVYLFEDKAKHIDEIKDAFPQVTAYFVQRPEDKPYGHIAPVCDCADKIIKNLELTIPK